MRGTLVRVSLAVTTMVALAFLIPLGLVIREIAADRTFTDAERQAAALLPALVITTDRAALEPAIASMPAGSTGRIAIHLPDGSILGRPRADERDLATARESARSFRVRAGSGWALLQPLVLDAGRVTVIEVYVPDGDLDHGVTTAWLVLTGVAGLLVGGSVVLADRLGAQVVRSARGLAAAARALGVGDLDVRIDPQGPSELQEAATSFNTMADRVEQLLANERELAADLSHRLRTPLTALRLNAAALGDDPLAEQTRHAVAQLEREVDEVIRTARRASASIEFVGCDAAEVVRERMAFWSALAEDEDRGWQLVGAEVPVRVPIARGELAAGLDAMLGNVFRHTEEGVPFSVTLHSGKDAVILLVADGGGGIDDPEAALRRGHGQGGDGSTGLGLDIVRRLAEATGGEVGIGRSVLGGAEISVRLGAGRATSVTRGSRRAAKRRRGRRRSPIS
ncbi:HAMP domain-containing sensor histidine kinase [Streptomyces sp. SID3343]|uniref:HAMP domain-containing sensor histidine kinase n=1 Tax=Streptomyces sp. SID3343 TaxID=2690260 RepID=UPI0013683D6E|nr:HAMP domain-containing sensor histidine kinase [Streptomyces sp. SID3343]MYW04622.1 HAMP domain-containing protein [Streptomyces sp. SID3343]